MTIALTVKVLVGKVVHQKAVNFEGRFLFLFLTAD